jgi:hypothetical protein
MKWPMLRGMTPTSPAWKSKVRAVPLAAKMVTRARPLMKKDHSSALAGVGVSICHVEMARD